MTVTQENALSLLQVKDIWNIILPIIPRKHFRVNVLPYSSVVNGVFGLCEKTLGMDT